MYKGIWKDRLNHHESASEGKRSPKKINKKNENDNRQIDQIRCLNEATMEKLLARPNNKSTNRTNHTSIGLSMD